MIILGLTGSIGMGKSTIASMFKHLGVPVHDADAEVAKMYEPSSPVYKDITAAFPAFQYPQIYNRKTQHLIRRNLGEVIFFDDIKRRKLEAILHPAVRLAQANFARSMHRLGRDIIVFEIPLLFETGGEKRVDYTVNVSATADMQKTRVMQRPGMSEQKLEAILARQMPDVQKCARADYVINTNLGLSQSMMQVQDVIRDVKTRRKALTTGARKSSSNRTTNSNKPHRPFRG